MVEHARRYWEGGRTFDSRCLELAEFFLEDEALLRPNVTGLAEHIQASVEEWIAAAKADADGRGL